MKKNWAIVFGVLLIIGGIGTITTDFRAGAFYIVSGAIFTALWILVRKRASYKKSNANHKTTSHIPPVEQPRTQITSPPAAQSAPKPAALVTPQPAVQTSPPTPPIAQTSTPIIPRPTTQDAPRSTLQTPQPAAQTAPKSAALVTPRPAVQTPPPAPPIVPKARIQIPRTKDGASLAYKYNISFFPFDIGMLDASANQQQLIAKQVGKEVHLFSAEADLGTLTEKADMVSDWLRRGDPYLAIVNQVDGESCHITFAFYRDKQKQYANREQSIIALTGYKAELKQDIITSLAIGDELEAEEDYEKEDRVIVSFTGDAIGSLPKKYAVRFINEGAALVVFDHYDEDEETFIAKPYIKIYW